ncbi:hypothetical protein BB560_002925 [Smittium megazygosporum]|uniref:Carbonyl reductase [NADPH] 1 n=1 Tax=Smittium megazygosporum TaxID=133381 RepID=A0A2T9ZDI9_9FUNG|nr:hypothetical protein BB560_002925 [Smittium megazygosporum]
MRLIVVTGANKGIGHALVKHLAAESSSASKIILTARSVQRGEQALKQLESETRSNWNPKTTVSFHQLDINDNKSISEFSAFLDKEFGKPCIDVLFDNAGWASMGSLLTADIASTTINTNYFGTVAFTEAMLEYMNPKSRIVIVSSILGKLNAVSKELAEKFSSDKLTIGELDGLMIDFVEAVRQDKTKEKGYPSNAYAYSKVGISAYARVLARKLKDDQRGIFVGSCHPGWIKTDMGGANAPHDVNYGVKTPLYLANEQIEKLYPHNGEYFSECKHEKW